LDACQQAITETPENLPKASTITQTSTQTPAQLQGATENQPTPTQIETPQVFPDLVVVKNAEPEPLIRAALSAIGGLERFVPKDSWVIIKPNICTSYHSFEYAATTNPWVVGTLVKMAFEAGAKKVQVMDSPFGGSAKDAYKVSGIAEQVEANGGEMVQMSAFKFKNRIIENPLSLNQTAIYEDVFKADVLIDVPIAKNHGLTTLSLGMKNLMGLIKDRGEIHRDFGNRLTDLAKTIKPKLTVIDAVRILTNNGPTGGNLEDVRKLDTVIVSADIVAADSYAATLFGITPDTLDFVRIGAQTGLGIGDLESLNIKEIDLAA
jgi:uncharacterized protein (DUF362 family)